MSKLENKSFSELTKKRIRYEVSFKSEKDKSKFITEGNNLNVACILVGYNYNVLRTRFKPEHLEKFKKARELKFNINK